MLVSAAHTGRSTSVKMQLLLKGETLPVGQVGPGFLLLKTPLDHPPAEGTLIVRVDDNEHRWLVRLPAGSCAADRRVTIEKL
jgi:hypothetical protein